MQNTSTQQTILITLLLAFFYSSFSHAASFNCKSKKLSSIEKLICSESSLSENDKYLNKIYTDALRESTGQEKQKLIESQRQWITEVRDKCIQDQIFCLNNAYNSRYAELLDVYSEARSKRMLPELSRRSGYSIEEINEVLGNCSENDRSMKMCAGLTSLRTRIAMDSALAQKLEASPSDCRDKLQATQKQWEKNMQGQCEKEAHDEFGDGSDATISYNTCMELGIEARTVQIQSIKSCDKLP